MCWRAAPLRIFGDFASSGRGRRGVNAFLIPLRGHLIRRARQLGITWSQLKAPMQATSKERYFFLCLLAAFVGFLIGLAIVKSSLHAPANSRVNWPSAAGLHR